MAKHIVLSATNIKGFDYADLQPENVCDHLYAADVLVIHVIGLDQVLIKGAWQSYVPAVKKSFSVNHSRQRIEDVKEKQLPGQQKLNF